MKFPRATGLRGVPALMVLAMARLVERKPAAQYAVAQRSLLVSKCTPGAKDADHTVYPDKTPKLRLVRVSKRFGVRVPQ